MSNLDEKLRNILDSLSREAFYEGYECDPNEDYSDDGWYPDSKEAVAQIKQAFIDENYVQVVDEPHGISHVQIVDPKDVHVHVCACGQIADTRFMTGKEWYERFEKEWVSNPIILNSGHMETAEDWITKIDTRVKEAVKRAGGIE